MSCLSVGDKVAKICHPFQMSFIVTMKSLTVYWVNSILILQPVVG